MISKRIILPALAMMTLLTGCFTGVEGTKKITQKDVDRVVKGLTEEEVKANSLAVPIDSFASWQQGKRFYASDDNVKLIFANSDAYDADTLSLKGRILAYSGYYLGSVLDNRATVNVKFTDGVNTYVYATDKTIDEIRPDYTIPFLIDMDVVEYIESQLRDKDCYVKTSIWYGEDERMIAGRKFVKVHIDDVLPGNKVFPIKVLFTDVETSRKAMLWMTLGGTVLKNRSFDALFSFTDVRNRYPNTTDEVWRCIVEGKTQPGMTKDEVRLSLGTPEHVNQLPTHAGVKEYWYYTDGRYYYFEDGLLVR